MSTIYGIILGILQGLTEFLPVSSSGHLVIFQDIFGVRQPGITFEIMVHFGTLMSVIWVFGKDIIRIVTGIFRGKQERYFAVMLLLGTIPTAFMGILLNDFFKQFYDSTLTTGFMLLITGGILYTLCFMKPGVKNEKTITAKDALIVSLAQGLAIIPGISRSGSTITTALWRGMDRETAVRFSFLISVPVILGVTLLELKDLSTAGFAGLTIQILYGTVAAFVSGVFAIHVFIRFLKAGRFHYFAYYCWLAGLSVIAWTLIG
jgi:undecaprenyl-diphosphatase